MSDVTRILDRVQQGDPKAAEELLPAVYEELRKLAAARMANEQSGHTLQPTALVHEAYLRLVRQTDVTWQNRAQFLGLAAVMMRRVLLDHARGRGADKRGGSWVRVPLEADAERAAPEAEFGDLERALEELAQQDARQARLVELRVFGGLSYEDAAEVLGVSLATARRDWMIARAWLFRRLSTPAGRRP